MLLSANLLGIVSALTSAFVWGGADFSGGFATRRSNQFQVLAIASLSGTGILVILAILWRDGFPSPLSTLWAALAGLFGSLGIAALYRALSMGYTARVAPTAAVIGAALPVGFSFLTDGVPSLSRLAGFGLAFVGIWLVSFSSTPESAESRRGFILACLAGLGFGGFFTFLAQVEPGDVFSPLIVARCVSFFTALLLLRIYRLPFPSLASQPIALLAGVLDSGGNVFFMLAKEYTSLDIAAVLGSLYPATTVLLARLLLKEKASRMQWVGVLVCLAAIGLITI
jgi:drug/metabolite transporter (DMT)-like permease